MIHTAKQLKDKVRNAEAILDKITSDSALEQMWKRFAKTYFFASNLEWNCVWKKNSDYIKKIL